MPATRRDVVFDSKGTRCSAFFYLPERAQAGERCPAIVVAHGIGSTKEMRLPAFAKLFAKRACKVVGFVPTLVSFGLARRGGLVPKMASPLAPHERRPGN
jgi:dienelactone hydrolase